MVVIVTNGTQLPKGDRLVERLRDNVPGLVSVVQNVNSKKTNVILGEENIVLWGRDHIVDYIDGLKFRISPLSFFQVNPIQTAVLYNKALDYAGLTGREVVLDAYCGIGTISLFMARKAAKVYGIEVVPQAIEDARINALENDIHNVEFIVGQAELVVQDMIDEGLKVDVIVVDPPRKGCDEKLLEAIIQAQPERMVYVSCNPATLARDLAYLSERGYRVVKVQPVDMFPQTAHVECVTLMSRVKE
jgi:23S rRNA (uracil1939-C5)-methyltransferase